MALQQINENDSGQVAAQKIFANDQENEASAAGKVGKNEVTFESVNLFDKTANYIESGGIGTDGGFFALASTGRLRHFPIPAGTKFIFSGIQSPRGLRFEKSDGALYQAGGFVANPTNGTVYTMPAGADWISVQLYDNNNTSSLNAVQINKGEVLQPYSAYDPRVTQLMGRNIQAKTVDPAATISGKQIADKPYIDEFKQEYDKFTSKSNPVALITPSASYAYARFVNAEQKGIRSWYFGRSTKTVNQIGTFWWKRANNGPINTDGRIQFLLERAGVTTIVMDKIIPAAELQRFNLASFTDYRVVELVTDLPAPLTIQENDKLFICQSLGAGMYPIYSEANPTAAGEWVNPATGNYYRQWQTSVPGTFTTIPTLPSLDNGYNPIHFYFNTLTEYSGLQDFDNRISALEQGTFQGALDFSFVAPGNLFVMNTPTFSDRKEAVQLFLQRFIREKKEITIDGRPFFTLINKDAVQTANVVQDALTFKLGGGAYVSKDVTINRVSVARSVMADKFPKVKFVMDSITADRLFGGKFIGGGAIWSMAKEIAEKNRADNNNVGYDYLCVGSNNGINNGAGTGTIQYTPKGQTVSQTLTLRGWAYGFGGWATPTFLRHPLRLWVTPAGGWDLLGLSRDNGAYTGTLAQKKLINATNYGAIAPVISANSYELLRSENQLTPNLGAWTGASDQIAQVEAWINGIATGTRAAPNGYFDINKTGSNRFSIDKYLNQYRTLANDGVTRLVAGSTAGSRITNVNAFDVCEFTHWIQGTGENDHLFHNDYVQIANDIMELANEVRAQRPNVIVGILSTDNPGSMFPDRTPDYYGKYAQAAHNAKYDFHAELLTRFGNLAAQKAAGIYYVPTWYTMTPLSHSNPSIQIDEGKPSGFLQIANDDTNHPGALGNRTGGQTLYNFIAATYAI